MRIQRQCETFAFRLGGEAWREHYQDYLGPREIPWTPERTEQREQVETELRRREQEGEIDPLDASNPQSMTDANQAYSDLFAGEGR